MSRRFMPLLSLGMALSFWGAAPSASADSHYESVIKDAAYRASIELPDGAAFVSLSEGVTYYRLANGESCTTADVLVHGFSVPSYIWDPTYDFLVSNGRCVVTLDLYGRGFSDNPDVAYTDTLFAKQVLELLDHLQIKKANLLGLSNGGRVVSQLAGLAPERVEQLIYVASSGFRDVSRAANVDVSQAEIDELVARYPELPAGQLSDFKDPTDFQGWDDKYAELLVHKGFARALISTRKNHDSRELDRIHAELQASDIPVTTIWGDSDTVVVYASFAEKLERLLPKRVEHFVPESGHLPHMENPAYFEAVLTELLVARHGSTIRHSIRHSPFTDELVSVLAPFRLK
ncbi:MAG: alpha/beta hydrolase [Pseudomonadota bacterium]|nr:alpha/beta hydrolase [Pseudomonadota bacterium]